MDARVVLGLRERQVLELAAEGLTCRETGARLHLATDTVRKYRERARRELGARNTTAAVVVALRRGLLL